MFSFSNRLSASTMDIYYVIGLVFLLLLSQLDPP